MSRIKEIYKELYNSYSYDHSYMERVRRCKDTADIPKVPNAGEIITQKDSVCSPSTLENIDVNKFKVSKNES